MAPRRTLEILEHLGPEAQQAFQENRTWEYQPPSAEYGDAWPFYGAGWYKVWLVPGWRIETEAAVPEGVKEWRPKDPLPPGAETTRLIHTVHEVDTGGNWEEVDQMDVDDKGYPSWWNLTYGPERNKKAWCDYFRDVLNTNHDPLREFIPPVTRERITWEFRAANSTHPDGGVILVAARMANTEWGQIDAPLPDNVVSFLGLEKRGDEVLISPESIKNVDDIRRADPKTVSISEDEVYGTFSYEADVPPPTDWRRKAVRKALKAC
jgi:hypothetical protein